MHKTFNNIIEMIGNTPLVKINKLNPNPNTQIFAKLEGWNPSGSIKDRMALKMVEQAEIEGKLTKDKVVLEPTSGNTGIALAIICVAKGYQLEIVMSEAVSIERRQIIKAYGGKITLTPADQGTDGAIRRARELLKENPDKYFMPDQFSNEYNKLAHYKTTAQEIWYQTEGQIDYFVSSLGTSGTIMGVGKYLKEKNPDIKIVCAQPVEKHYIQGLKNMKEAIVPAIYEPDKIDEQIMIDSEDAFEMARRIIREEAIFVGMSSGAAMLAAFEVAKRAETGNIIVIFPDRAEKYLSTNLFNYI